MSGPVEATLLHSGLAPFLAAGSVLEVRILDTPKKTVSGYFDNLDVATKALEQATSEFNGAATFYVTLNPIKIDCHARAVNRLKPFAHITSADTDVLRRHFLLIDCDPKRPAGLSSTNEELAAALARRDAIVAALTGEGWPAPIRAMSGNGAHAVYRIDLPNTDPARDLVRGCLLALTNTFSDAGVEIDRSVFNAARIVKAYGTWARKGDSTVERPHRQSYIEDLPTALAVVTEAQLARLANQVPNPIVRPPGPGFGASSPLLNYQDEFAARGDYLGPLRDGKHAVRCPWRDAHSGESGISETVIFEPTTPGGLWGFKCQHQHCIDRTNRDVWELFRAPTAATKGARTSAITATPTAKMSRKLVSGADDIDQPIPLGDYDALTGRLVLSPRRTLPTATAYVRQFHQHPDGRLLHAQAGLLLEWSENRYAQVEDAAITCRLQEWLHLALRYIVIDRRTGAMALADFESNPTSFKQALDSIRAYVHLPAAVTSPSWLDGQPHPPALEILPCRSMNVHLPTGKMLPSTPALFTTSALDFDYNPQAAGAEQWLTFLDQLWPDDPGSISLLQEWFGYSLIADTSQQKMLLLVGPRRGGKGTIGRILTRLVGSANVVGPTTGSLAGQFGLQPLIGKSLAIVSDARFTGDHVSTVVERLLCISGEDTLTIDRKFLGAVTLKLPTRFVFLTNELPRLNDASTALAGRFLVLQGTHSFYGAEDPTLTDRLSTELPGILRWAIEGWVRLQERGRFVQPSSAADAIQELEDLGSPVRPFIREYCAVLPTLTVPVDTLYGAWEMWCRQNGRKANDKQMFGRNLASAIPGGVTRRRGTAFVPFYEGIGLTPETAEALDKFEKARGTRTREADGD